MKKLLLPLAVALAVALIASSATALNLPGSLYNAKMYDRSSIFSNSMPEVAGQSVDPGDEQRNVFTIDLLEWQGTKADIGQPGDISGGPPYSAVSSGQLTGLMYDVDFRATESGAPSYVGGNDTLYFDAGARYTAGTDWVDTYQPGGFDAASAPGAGGILIIYEDAANPIYASGLDGISPLTWTEKNIATGDAALPMSDGLLPVSDVQPWLILALMPNPLIAGVNALPTDLIQETFFVFPNGQFLAFGTAFGNIIGGTATQDTEFFYDLFGQGLDLKLNFSASNPSVNSLWQLNSSDPAMFGVVPEPMTLSLLGLGLVGLGAWRRRRNVS